MRRRTVAAAVATVLGVGLAGLAPHAPVDPASATPGPGQGPGHGASQAPGPRQGPPSSPREVMFVGNNWEGTATVVDAHTHEPVRTLGIIPDRAEEMRAIWTDPVRLGFYLGVRTAVGEGNDQYVDDMFTTPDGRLLAVSRPSFADVVWIDLASGEIVAEQQMDGHRTDHMQVSPDGERLLVSDSTAGTVHEYVMGGAGDPETGERLRSFPSGETPHESEYLKDGSEILHASIGRVYTPLDAGELDAVGDVIKGDRWFQRVRESDFEVLQRWDLGRELEEAGYPRMSSAVRPMAVAPDQRTVYLQVSFLHGFVEFDLDAPDLNDRVDYTSGDRPEPRTGAVRRVVTLPQSEEVQRMPREQYLLDSAHHGLAIDEAGEKLCVAGTMSDYAAIVHTQTDRRRFHHGGEKPYWATTSPFSNHCWMSMSGTDEVFVIDYDTEEVVSRVPVGDHPQRVREGHLAPEVEDAWTS